MGSAWQLDWGQWAFGFHTYRVYADGGRWLRIFLGPVSFTHEFLPPPEHAP